MTEETIEKQKPAFLVIQEGALMGYASKTEFRYEYFSTLGRERLWEAFREKEQRARWFGDIEIADKVGFPFVFAAGAGHTHAGEVIEYDPGKFVKFSWVEVGQKTKVDAENAIATFEFLDTPGGGKVIYTQGPVNKPTKYGAGTHAHMDMLHSFLEGESFPFKERFNERYYYWVPHYEKAFGPLKD